MTRGYACITNGPKIEKVAYLQSDAYLSFYGVEILEAIQGNTLEAWFKKQIRYNHELYNNDEPNPGFDLNFIRKTKECPSGQTEYGYLFDRKTEELKVYNYGVLIAVVPKDQREKYLYFFRNSNEIRGALTYDPEKLAYSKKVNMNRIVSNASVKDLEFWKTEGEKQVMVLDDRHLIAAGYSNKYPVYSKKLWWDNAEHPKAVEFFANKNAFDSFWSVTIQLPFCRVSIGNDHYRSEVAAVNCIRTLCKENPSRMERFADVFARYEEFIKNAENMDISRIREFAGELKEEYDKDPWYIARGYFTVDKIEEVLKDRYYVISARAANNA